MHTLLYAIILNLTPLEKEVKILKGDGKIEFFQHKEKIKEQLEKGVPKKRIFEELNFQKISYSQFIKHTQRYITNENS